MESSTLNKQTASNDLGIQMPTFEDYFELSMDLLCIASTDGRFLRLNLQWEKTLGYRREELEGKPFMDLVHPEDQVTTLKVLSDLAGQKEVIDFENRYRCKDGCYRWIQWRSRPAGEMIIAAARDITEWKQAQLALEKLSFFVDHASDAVFWMGQDSSFKYVNDQACRSLGYSHEELLKMRLPDIDPVFTIDMWNELWNSYQPNRKVDETRINSFHRRKDGSVFPVEVIAKHIWFADEEVHVAMVRDMSERKQAEAEREKLQVQLAQAQKMESVGRLAGGVAHDFNNMLQAIIGNADLALQESQPGTLLRECLEEIQLSSQRSADLTRQLLAFARKQTIKPQTLNLNETISGMLKMLLRLIAANIDLKWSPAPDLWMIKMDPSQVDQILANLSVNASDAIHGSGSISIATANVVLDASTPISNMEYAPGEYVVLSVSDTGCGMSEEVQSHLFEPFFTTKETGRGTGLGMATVFGIVKQNKGLIHVYSELNKGTTIKVYIPRSTEVAPLPAADALQPSSSGAETILFVEDEPQVLKLGRKMLEQKGYRILSAQSPAAAIELAARHQGPIDLLVTDVVMPEMNGKELMMEVARIYPSIKTLYMSGYTSDVIAHHGILDEGVNLLQKPFTIRSLSEKVRNTLDMTS